MTTILQKLKYASDDGLMTVAGHSVMQSFEWKSTAGESVGAFCGYNNESQKSIISSLESKIIIFEW